MLTAYSNESLSNGRPSRMSQPTTPGPPWRSEFTHPATTQPTQPQLRRLTGGCFTSGATATPRIRGNAPKFPTLDPEAPATPPRRCGKQVAQEVGVPDPEEVRRQEDSEVRIEGQERLQEVLLVPKSE